jgi:hypothetical protein
VAIALKKRPQTFFQQFINPRGVDFISPMGVFGAVLGAHAFPEINGGMPHCQFGFTFDFDIAKLGFE